MVKRSDQEEREKKKKRRDIKEIKVKRIEKKIEQTDHSCPISHFRST